MKNVYHPAMNMQKDENNKKERNTIKMTKIFAMFCGFLLDVTLIDEEITHIVLSVSAHVARIIRLFKTF